MFLWLLLGGYTVRWQKREIAICLLKSPMDLHKKTTGGAIANLPSDYRYDAADHFKVSTT